MVNFGLAQVVNFRLSLLLIRGVERRDIFDDNKDRDNLWKRLGELLPATEVLCYAYLV